MYEIRVQLTLHRLEIQICSFFENGGHCNQRKSTIFGISQGYFMISGEEFLSQWILFLPLAKSGLPGRTANKTRVNLFSFFQFFKK